MRKTMASKAVEALTRETIIITARNFRWNRRMPKWTTVVEGRELPARPLVLTAARVRPNDPTNSHMAIAKLKELGFETRYDEPMAEAGKWCKAIYLDASAIVKIYVDEPHSPDVRSVFYSQPKPFNTTPLCLAEAFSVLKRKWTKADLTTDAYLEAANNLTIAAWGQEIEVQGYGFLDPFIQKDAEKIVKTHGVDLSDALQLLTILKGQHSGLVNQSLSWLITGDRDLTAAAVATGVKVWNCMEPAPPDLFQ
jgi:predicted nucleic acid-binding protein